MSAAGRGGRVQLRQRGTLPSHGVRAELRPPDTSPLPGRMPFIIIFLTVLNKPTVILFILMKAIYAVQ